MRGKYVKITELTDKKRIQLLNKYSKRPNVNVSIGGKKHTTMSTHFINTTKKSSYGKSGYVSKCDTYDVCLTFTRKKPYSDNTKLPTTIAQKPIRNLGKISKRKRKALEKKTILVDIDKETEFQKRVLKEKGFNSLMEYQKERTK